MSIDWSDISKLKFRDFDAKILEVFVPKNEECRSQNYPVTIFYKNKNGEIHQAHVTLDGIYVKDTEGSRDIIQITEEPFSFLEIVELIGKGAKFRNTEVDEEMDIICVDFIGKWLQYFVPNSLAHVKTYDYFLEKVLYSLDGNNYSKLYKEK